MGYPDQTPLLDAGYTLNRFTEFNAARHRYNEIRETAGFNFATLSWTHFPSRFDGWSTNLTVGAGPTRDQPSRAIQNEGVHRWLGFERVPVGTLRDATDFMLDGSVTRWAAVLGRPRTAFAGAGLSAGSLYQEVFARIGVRRLALADLVGVDPAETSPLAIVLRSVRFSALGRYSRLWSGAAYREVAPESFLVQASMSIGDYRGDPSRPLWEIEFTYTVDSGLFVASNGSTIEEQFASVALRVGFFTFETWNDSINGQDKGPTYGGKVMIDLFRLFGR